MANYRFRTAHVDGVLIPFIELPAVLRMLYAAQRENDIEGLIKALERVYNGRD